MLKRLTSGYSLSRISRIFGHAKYPKKKHCCYCKYRGIYRLSDGRYKCKRCKAKFSLLTNTYLERSHVSLDQWYELLWWFAYEFTANKTARELNISQSTVHRCFMVIRKAIHDYQNIQARKLFGKVEADETYVGAKFKNRRKSRRQYYRKINAVKRGRGAKTLHQTVFGLYQRDGSVYVEFVKDADAKTLHDIIKGKIVLESEIYTDTWGSYKGLDEQGYYHEVIDHGKQQYVKKKRGKRIHINGIEGFWGYLKEKLLKHHGVSKENLIFYIKEQEFRFNNRHLSTEELIVKFIQALLKSGP